MKHAEKLKYYREREGLSVLDLAGKLHMTGQSIVRWEKGKNEPTADNLKRLSKLYGVSIDELLSEDEPCTDISEVEAAVEPPVEEVEIPEEKPDESTAPTPASTAQKLPLRYKIALCSAVALCVFLGLALIFACTDQNKQQEQRCDITVTQDGMSTKPFDTAASTEIDMLLPDE